MNTEQWNVRFGQILRQQLDQLEESQPGQFRTRLQDCFFYHPEEMTLLNDPPEDPYTPINLDNNVNVYRKYFTPVKCSAAPDLDTHLAKKMDATIILVPGIVSNYLPNIRLLEGDFHSVRLAGFDVRLAEFPHKPESSKAAGKMLAEMISEWNDLHSNLIFIGFSYGILSVFEMLKEKTFRPFAKRVQGIVSLAGTLSGVPKMNLMEDALAKDVLEIYQKIHEQKHSALQAKFVKTLKSAVDLKVPWSEAVRKIVETIQDFSDDLIDFPEEQEKIEISEEHWPAPENFDLNIPLFSISAICPRHSLQGNGLLPTNPDDLFLFLISRELYEKGSPYNDGQLLTRETRFPDEKGVHLATVHSDHWGLAFPKVLGKTYSDTFPRPAIYETLLLALFEYFSENPKESNEEQPETD